jgi:glycosyltransferase involved in cell wall biosynthesis
LAVRNEAENLAAAVERIYAQDYGGPFEVVMAVGPSNDDTQAQAESLAEHYDSLTVVANPSGGTPQGLNLAWRAAKFDYLVRVDGHSMLPPGYISQAVALLERTRAANVGGMMVPEGNSPFQRAVAVAMSSPYGIGSESFHTGGEPGPARTVYLGNYRRADLEAVGGFNEEFTRAQDWELNHRLIQAGKTVWFDPSLSVVYRPRASWRELAAQFYRTGQWRCHVIKRYPRTVSARYLAPPLVTAVIGLGLGLGLAGLVRRSGGLTLALTFPGLYALGVVGVAASARDNLDRAAKRLLPLVLATMHLAWGAGFLRALPDGWLKRHQPSDGPI